MIRTVTERCERMDLVDDSVESDGPVIAVQCVLDAGHHGRHRFVHEWTDPRDRRPT